MHWFPFYSSDFLGATVGLSCLERSLYALMLPLYYEVGPFPIERVRVYRIIGCESDEQKRAVDYLLEQFFVEREDGWYQPKAEEVKVRQAQAHNVLSEAGKKGNAIKWASKSQHTRSGGESGGDRVAIGGDSLIQNQNQNQIKKERTLAGSVSRSKPPLRPEDVVFELPCAGGDKVFQVSGQLIAELEPAYPAVDVMATLREMRAWLVSNPARQKTQRGCPAFINRWFAKEQNRG